MQRNGWRPRDGRGRRARMRARGNVRDGWTAARMEARGRTTGGREEQIHPLWLRRGRRRGRAHTARTEMLLDGRRWTRCCCCYDEDGAVTGDTGRDLAAAAAMTQR